MTVLQTSSKLARTKDLLPVLAFLLLGLGATLALWIFESNQIKDRSQARFERETVDLKEDIVATMYAYAQVLRGGAGLFHSSSFVSRDEWAQYVRDLDLGAKFPGIQGIGYNALLRGEADMLAFQDRVRANDWPAFTIRPEGVRDVYTPVLYLEPMDWRNERAIGFDVYSEAMRRSATDLAIARGQPQVTGKITLVQEDPDGGNKDVQSGVLLLMPVYDTTQLQDIETATDRRNGTVGIMTAVFRMGDLTAALLKQKDSSSARMDLTLYDAIKPNDDSILFASTAAEEKRQVASKYQSTKTIEMFGRNWTLATQSTAFFEAEAASNSPEVILGAGLLLTALLTALAWGQSVRARESARAASVLAGSQEHVQFLMGEVNHRSKNLLALVEAIARQSAGTTGAKANPKEFMTQFSNRVKALAANQDLLVRNEWKGIGLNELVRSQLAHFEGLLDNRILLDGPGFQLNPGAAQTVGMAIHELATIAGKYGALSNDAGTVDIKWHLKTSEKGQSRLLLSWIETGGPPVKAPSEGGFGSKVIGVMAKQSLTASIETSFEASGFAWHMDCPTRAAAELGDHLK